MSKWIPFFFLGWNFIGYMGAAASSWYFKTNAVWYWFVGVYVCYAISIIFLMLAEKGFMK